MGSEVVQWYLRDDFGSVTRPVQELKGFEKVEIAPGQSKQITFTIEAEMLAFTGRNGRRIIETGSCAVLVGGSSETELEQAFTIV